MAETTAQRTLVKSPPELWAEISDLGALARHLGEFGEIRITRLEPETAVAWEGDRARGTVQLEPSGWGTRVTLTAEMPDGGEAADPAEPAAPHEAEASPPEASEVDAPAEAEAEAERQAVAPPAPAEPKRPGLFARLFRRRGRQDEPGPVAEQEPVAEEALAAEPVAEPVAEQALAEEPVTEPTAAGERPAPAPDLSLDLGRAEAILTEVLDDLGSARHRPFSRMS